MSTVLRLPHMDIVLECEHNVRSKRNGNRETLNLRRSDRLRNVSGGSQQAERRSKRRRYNSVMDDQEEHENQEDDDQDQGDRRRQEPEHRHLNRMKMQRQNVIISSFEKMFDFTEYLRLILIRPSNLLRITKKKRVWLRFC